jgi:predicted nucleic acid-binding protein
MLLRGDRLFTSTFTLGELLVAPYQTGRSNLARQYDDLLRGPAVTLIPFDNRAAIQYAMIRVHDAKISPQDAIHLACASVAEVDLFLTNDTALLGKTIPGIKFIASLTQAPL